jgi:hypothetical protein
MRYVRSILSIAFATGLLAACSTNSSTPSAGAGLASIAQLSSQTAGTKVVLKPGTVLKVALQTYFGDYVTALHGGSNRPQANCGPGQVALHENATQARVEESFNLISEGSNQGSKIYAFQITYNSPVLEYITAVNGGGMGSTGKGRNNSLLTTNATTIRKNQIFYIVPSPYDTSEVAIQTPDRQHYITAIAPCPIGSKTSNTVPFHTNATTVGNWEKFTFVPQ